MAERLRASSTVGDATYSTTGVLPWVRNKNARETPGGGGGSAKRSAPGIKKGGAASKDSERRVSNGHRTGQAEAEAAAAMTALAGCLAMHPGAPSSSFSSAKGNKNKPAPVRHSPAPLASPTPKKRKEVGGKPVVGGGGTAKASDRTAASGMGTGDPFQTGESASSVKVEAPDLSDDVDSRAGGVGGGFEVGKDRDKENGGEEEGDRGEGLLHKRKAAIVGGRQGPKKKGKVGCVGSRERVSVCACGLFFCPRWQEVVWRLASGWGFCGTGRDSARRR